MPDGNANLFGNLMAAVDFFKLTLGAKVITDPEVSKATHTTWSEPINRNSICIFNSLFSECKKWLS